MTYHQIVQSFIHRLDPLSVAQSVRDASSRLNEVLARAVEMFRRSFSNDLVVDLGTSNTIIYVPNQGVVVNEPSVVAFNNDTNQVVAIGLEAKMALGRQASTIRVVHPLKDGVIADFDAAEIMLSYFIKCALGRRKLFNPRLLICAPGEVTPVERRALEDAGKRIGARHVDVIEEPIAAAIGAGFDIQSGSVFMLVDIGGGTTDIAVLGYGGPVHLSTLRVGGCKMDEAIIQHMRHTHCVEIGELTAEAIKLEIEQAGSNESNQIIEVRGRNLKTGLPAAITATREEARSAIGPIIEEIIQGVRNCLDELSPEVSADLLECGMVLTGRASQVAGIADRINRETGIETRLASNVESVAAIGAVKLFRDGSLAAIRRPMAHRRAENIRGPNNSYTKADQ